MEKQKFKCLRCGWEWNPIVPKPSTCPKCKSYRWKEKRKREKIPEEFSFLSEVGKKNKNNIDKNYVEGNNLDLSDLDD